MKHIERTGEQQAGSEAPERSAFAQATRWPTWWGIQIQPPAGDDQRIVNPQRSASSITSSGEDQRSVPDPLPCNRPVCSSYKVAMIAAPLPK